MSELKLTINLHDIRLFDTAPLYGSGVSEKRLGKFLNTKNRDDYVISTKVGRLIVDTDKSKAAEFFIGSPKDKDSEFNFTYDGGNGTVRYGSKITFDGNIFG